MDSLVGKVALVTGGSRGIGPFIAKALARSGAHVVAVARDRAGLEVTCAEIEREGGRAIAVPADLGDVGALGRLLAEVKAKAGPIDVLVNNAGVEYYRRYAEYRPEELAAVLTINLHVPMELTRQLLPELLARRSGHIVNIASLAGKKGVLYNGPYSASKAGLILWTDSLRQELRDTGVGVSVIMPGYIRDAGMFHGDGVDPPKLLGTSTPEDVATAVVDAIRQDRHETIVNPGPMRPMLALGALSPTLASRIVEWIGVNRLNEARRRDPEG